MKATSFLIYNDFSVSCWLMDDILPEFARLSTTTNRYPIAIVKVKQRNSVN